VFSDDSDGSLNNTVTFTKLIKRNLAFLEVTVPGVPSLVSRRKMTLKLNYIYMKVLWMHKYCSPPQKLGITFLLKLIT
jgi:hypothetical protein